MAQKMSSPTTRSGSDRLPSMNSDSASSRYSRASWYASRTFLLEMSRQVSKRLRTTREALSGSTSGALPTSNSPIPKASTTSTEWWATTARPDSVTMVGCATPAASQISCRLNTRSLAYSCKV